MPPIWLLKAVLAFAVAGDLLFMREYWTSTKGGWLRDPIGLTLMLEAFAFFGTMGLLVFAAFVNLNQDTLTVLTWVEDGLLFSCGLVYWWRTWVFHRERPKVLRPEKGSVNDDGCAVSGDTAGG